MLLEHHLEFKVHKELLVLREHHKAQQVQLGSHRERQVQQDQKVQVVLKDSKVFKGQEAHKELKVLKPVVLKGHKVPLVPRELKDHKVPFPIQD